MTRDPSQARAVRSARTARQKRPAPPFAGFDDAARVLAMAADPRRPLADRVRLRAVLVRHLDGVFRTRVVPAVPPEPGAAPPPVPVASRVLHDLVADDDGLVHDHLVPALRAAGVAFVDRADLTRAEAAVVRRLLRNRVHPLLTPMAVDGSRPFPALPCGSLTVAAQVLEQPGAAPRLGCVGLPPSLPRVVPLGRGRLITTESLVAALLPELFAGTRVVEYACLRVTRAAGRTADGRPAAVTRVEIERSAGAETVDALARQLGTTAEQIYPVRSSLAMGDALSAAVPDEPDYEDGQDQHTEAP